MLYSGIIFSGIGSATVTLIVAPLSEPFCLIVNISPFTYPLPGLFISSVSILLLWPGALITLNILTVNPEPIPVFAKVSISFPTE